METEQRLHSAPLSPLKKTSYLQVILCWFMLIAGLPTISHSQTTEIEQLETEALKLFDDGEYAEAAVLFGQIAEFYIQTEGIRNDYVGFYFEMAGLSHEFNSNFDKAYHYYQKALSYYPPVSDTIVQDGFHSTEGYSYRRTIFNAANSVIQIKNYDLDVEIPERHKPVTAEIYVPILQILDTNGQFVTVLIDAGYYDGVFDNARGGAFGTYSTDYPDRGNESVGTAQVTAVQKNFAIVEIMVTESDDPTMTPWVGDMVLLPMRVENRDFKSLLYELTELNIRFRNNSGDRFFHPRQIFDYDSELLETQIFHAMIEDIKDTVDMIIGFAADEWLIPYETGRFAGKSMIDAMLTTTVDDLKAFLYFVKSYPGKYMGGDWKINETYATWVINFGPPGADELLHILLGLETPQEINEFAEKYRKDILDGNFIDNWQLRVNGYADSGNYAPGEDLIIRILQVVRNYDDTELMAWAEFTYGYLLDAERRFEEAKERLSTAHALFIQVGNIRGASFCLNNTATIFNKTLRYEAAAEKFLQSLELKLLDDETDPSSATKSSIARTLYGIASAYNNLGRLSDSMQHYELAIEYYQMANTISAVREMATLYQYIGKVYERQGDVQNAMRSYQREYEMHMELGDEASAASAIDRLAFVTSNSDESNRLYKLAYETKMRLNLLDGAAFSLSNVAQTYWQLGEHEKAIQNHLEAIRIREQIGNKSGQAYSWGKLADLYEVSGQPVRSIQAYDRALALYLEAGDEKQAAGIYEAMSKAQRNLGNFPEARNFLDKAISLYQRIDAMYEYSLALSDMGDIYYDENEFDKAEEFYLESNRLMEQVGNQTGLIYNLTRLGNVYRFFKVDLNRALHYTDRAIELSNETNNEQDLAFSLSAKAGIYLELGKFEEAYELFNYLVDFYRKTGDRQQEAGNLGNLAYYHTLIAEFDKAESLYHQQKNIGEEIGNASIMASAYSGLADLHRIRGNYGQVLEINLEARRLYKEVENPYGVASSYIGSGNFYNLIGEYEQAIREYAKADSIYLDLSIEYFRATPMNNMGNVLYMQGNYDAALEMFKQAFERNNVDGAKSSFSLMIVNNIGDTYQALKMYDEAKEWIDISLQMALETGNERRRLAAMRSRGRLKLDLNDVDGAIEDLQSAYDGNKINFEPEFHIEVGMTLGRAHLNLGRRDEARSFLEEAVSISNDIGSRRYLWEVFGYLADLELHAGNNAAALQYYRQAVEIIEYTRNRVAGGEEARKLFTSGQEKMQIYENIVSLLMQKGEIEEAMAYAVSANNENMMAQLQSGRQVSGDSSIRQAQELRLYVEGIENNLTQQRARPAELRNNILIQELESMKRVAEEEYNAFVREVVARDENLTRHLAKTVNPEELRRHRRRIPAEVAVVQYLISPNALYIFIAGPDSVVAREIPVRKSDLDQKVLALYNQIKHRPSGTQRTIHRDVPVEIAQDADIEILIDELYQLLIAPIETHLEGKETLAIIPNGTLNMLPFQILMPYENRGLMLNNRFNIFYSNDFSVFLMMPDEIEQFNLLAIGNADESLAFAEEEVRLLGGIFPDSEILIRREATKSRMNALLQGYNILHFATHGVLDYNSIDNSFLVLASDPVSGHDGRLTIREIEGIDNLDYLRLVTLSACETQFPLEHVSGWPVNTALAFLNTGVSSVVASLWKVDDEATSILMQYFYQNLGEMGTAEALRMAQAQLANDERFSHPYFWAPFQLLGEWR